MTKNPNEQSNASSDPPKWDRKKDSPKPKKKKRTPLHPHINDEPGEG